MQYYRCKCGKAEAWSSMGVHQCQGCDECNTSFARDPSGHKELIPHDWRVMYDDHTGKPNRRICKRCGEYDIVKDSDAKTYAELEEENTTLKKRLADLGIWHDSSQ